MKRFVTIFVCCAFLGYFVVFSANFKTLGLTKLPLVGHTISAAKNFIGLGGLFHSEKKINSNACSYRFHQQGKWQEWQQLEQASFDTYLETGNLVALNHCRIDRRLVNAIVRQVLNKDAAIYQSKQMKALLAHLVYAHNQRSKPDSVELQIRQGKRIDKISVRTYHLKIAP